MDALQRLYLLLFAFKVRKNPVEGKKRKKKKKKPPFQKQFSGGDNKGQSICPINSI